MFEGPIDTLVPVLYAGDDRFAYLFLYGPLIGRCPLPAFDQSQRFEHHSIHVVSPQVTIRQRSRTFQWGGGRGLLWAVGVFGDVSTSLDMPQTGGCLLQGFNSR